MSDVARQGRTVLFVSHSMAAIEHLCRRGLLLQAGKVACLGTQTEAIRKYLGGSGAYHTSLRERTDRTGTGEVRLTGIEITDDAGVALQAVSSGQNIEIRFHFEADESRRRSNVVAGVLVTTQQDVPVFLQHNKLSGDRFGPLPASGAFICQLPNLPLPPGSYRFTCSIMCGEEYLDMVIDAGELTVVEGDFFGTGMVMPATHGCCLVPARWKLGA
jgi:lipopolysaccharide transport system ATP-binding protein